MAPGRCGLIRDKKEVVVVEHTIENKKRGLVQRQIFVDIENKERSKVARDHSLSSFVWDGFIIH